jgi:hypothetical protein
MPRISRPPRARTKTGSAGSIAGKLPSGKTTASLALAMSTRFLSRHLQGYRPASCYPGREAAVRSRALVTVAVDRIRPFPPPPASAAPGGRGPVRLGARPASGSSPSQVAARRAFVIEADRDPLDEVAGHLRLPPVVDPRGPRVGGPPTLRSIRPKRASHRALHPENGSSGRA